MRVGADELRAGAQPRSECPHHLALTTCWRRKRRRGALRRTGQAGADDAGKSAHITWRRQLRGRFARNDCWLGADEADETSALPVRAWRLGDAWAFEMHTCQLGPNWPTSQGGGDAEVMRALLPARSHASKTRDLLPTTAQPLDCGDLSPLSSPRRLVGASRSPPGRGGDISKL